MVQDLKLSHTVNMSLSLREENLKKNIWAHKRIPNMESQNQ